MVKVSYEKKIGDASAKWEVETDFDSPTVAINTLKELIPATSEGAAAWTVVPSPICPESFEPQQKMRRSDVAAQVWKPPPATTDTSARPATATGRA